MGGELNINYTDLLGKSDIAENYCADLRKNMGCLYDAVNKLNGGWESPSKEEFVKVFREDFKRLEMMAENMIKMSGCIRYALDAYQKTERQVSNFIDEM